MAELFPAQPDSSASNVAETPAAPAAAGSLVRKLAEACDAVGGVEKKGRNTAQGYNYVRATDVAMAFRHELFKRGIVAIPNEIQCETRQISFVNAKGETRHANEVILNTAYTITDGIDTLVMHGYGIAWDSGDKAVYKAKTGALKYFLRGLGLIPDELEPESDETTDKIAKEYEKDFEQKTEGQRLVALHQINAWTTQVGKVRTEAQAKAYLGKLGIKSIEEMQRQDFNDAIKWLMNPQIKDDLTKELTESVKAVPPKVKALNFASLFATAKDKGIPEADVKQYSYETFGIKSMTELTPSQFREVQDWIGTLA